MKQFALALASLMIGSQALAYKDGVYRCKNTDGLPDLTYTIQTVKLGDPGPSLPYIELVRYFRENPGDTNSPVIETRMKGLANVATDEAGIETLILSAIRLNFQGDQLLNCRK